MKDVLFILKEQEKLMRFHYQKTVYFLCCVNTDRI